MIVRYQRTYTTLVGALDWYRDEVAELASSWDWEMRRITVSLLDAMVAAKPQYMWAAESMVERFARYEGLPDGVTTEDTYTRQYDWAVEAISRMLKRLEH